MTVDIKRHDRILEIVLDEPQRSNALTEAAVEAMLDALTGKNSEGLALAIFKGRGKNFCSGFDLADIESETDGSLLYRMLRLELLLQEIFHAPFLTLALTQGKAIGAGADLVCACALRAASPEATFRMPGWRFGVALGTRRLTLRVGPDVARQYLLASATFDAQQALDVSFLQKVVPVEEWPEVERSAFVQASTISGESLAEALSLTRPDTRAEDIAALVRTAGRPGLRKRILDYKASVLRTR